MRRVNELGDGLRVRIGAVPIDPLTLKQALAAVEELVRAGEGGYVVTPNVDHVVNAERLPEFREAYRHAGLSLVDGMPLLWAAKVFGTPLPQKLSGSDLLAPLCARAAFNGWRVFLLGGPPGAAEGAAERLRRQCAVNIVGAAGPRVDADGGDPGSREALRLIREARPDLVFVGFGSPKQELWLYRHREQLRPAVGVAVGAALEFASGRLRRAPRWMSEHGLEWLFRLSQEPRRLWRRYLVDDPRFLAILGRQLLRGADAG